MMKRVFKGIFSAKTDENPLKPTEINIPTSLHHSSNQRGQSQRIHRLTQPALKQMGSLQINPSKPTTSTKHEIYIATMPLRATKGPPQLLMSAAYSLNLWHLQHFMIILKPSPLSISQGLVFDFQPQDPDNIFVALAALSGRPIPGAILTRNISKLPKKRCWYVGLSTSDNAVEAAYKYNSSWPNDLRIGKHDCRHYTDGLAEVLTGEKNALERLRMNYYH